MTKVPGPVLSILMLLFLFPVWRFIAGDVGGWSKPQDASMELIRSRPASATAKVTKLHKEVGGGKSHRPYVLYAFEVDGKTYEGKAFMERSVGSSLNITYCAGNPDLSCVGRPSAAPARQGFLGHSGAWWGVTIIFLMMALGALIGPNVKTDLKALLEKPIG